MSIIPQAFADGASAAGGFDFTGFIPFALIIVVMYFLMIRPQQKKAKEHQAILSRLSKGDKVITAGGFMGIVAKNPGESNEIEVDIAKGVTVTMLRASISQVVDSSTAKTVRKKSDK